jgi:Asp-tRNA(Asn)/Glu-tRNA(Gln) amidotransferase C subunit
MMPGAVCLRSRASLRFAILASKAKAPSTRKYSAKRVLETEADTAEFLSKPSWSVKSLLPSATNASATPSTTPEQLSHLLRLSALPQPKDAAEEASMIAMLESQLHFVKEIQKVDTTGVEPLQAIREETEEAVAERTIGLETLKKALAQEEFKGKMKRPKRREGEPKEMDHKWEPLATANRTAGEYFVVKNGKN